MSINVLQSYEFYESLLHEWEERFGFKLDDELYEIVSASRKKSPVFDDENSEFPALMSATGKKCG